MSSSKNSAKRSAPSKNSANSTSSTSNNHDQKPDVDDSDDEDESDIVIMCESPPTSPKLKKSFNLPLLTKKTASKPVAATPSAPPANTPVPIPFSPATSALVPATVPVLGTNPAPVPVQIPAPTLTEKERKAATANLLDMLKHAQSQPATAASPAAALNNQDSTLNPAQSSLDSPAPATSSVKSTTSMGPPSLFPKQPTKKTHAAVSTTSQPTVAASNNTPPNDTTTTQPPAHGLPDFHASTTAPIYTPDMSYPSTQTIIPDTQDSSMEDVEPTCAPDMAQGQPENSDHDTIQDVEMTQVEHDDQSNIGIDSYYPTTFIQAPAQDNSGFASSDGDMLVAHIDQSLHGITKNFAGELKAYYEDREQKKWGVLQESVEGLKNILSNMTNMVAGCTPRAQEELATALYSCTSAVQELHDGQVAATRQADAHHAEVMSQMKKNQALLEQVSLNQIRTAEEQSEIGKKIEENRVQSERQARENKVSIEDKVLRSQLETGEELRQSQQRAEEQLRNQSAILSQQSDSNVNIEGRVKEVKDLVILAATQNSFPPPLPTPPPPSTKDRYLTVFVSLDNGSSLKKYAYWAMPIEIELAKAHSMREVITMINQVYGRAAQDTSTSDSKMFSLVYIAIPAEGENEGSTIVSGGRWASWVKTTVVHEPTQVKVRWVFKLVAAPDTPQKKRKLDDDHQGKVIDGSESDDGRNYFRAHGW